jgi:hypothetical protein
VTDPAQVLVAAAMTSPGVAFAERNVDFQVSCSLTDRVARCVCCTFSKTAPRGVPMSWVTHRCPGLGNRIVLWESA